MHARRDLGNDGVGELERGYSIFVHAGCADVARAFHFERIFERFACHSPRDEPRHGDAIAADIQNAAAAEFGAEETAQWIKWAAKAKGGPDEFDLAHDLFADQLGQPHRLRVAAVHKPFHQKHAVTAGGVDDRLRFVVVHGERLLAKNVFAGFGCPDRPFGMHRVRRGNVNGLHSGIGQHRLVATVTGRREIFRERED